LSERVGNITGQGILTDREIAEDILTSKKHLSNYYYAPAALEARDPQLRSTFQQVHSDSQSEAKRVFDYLSQRGWYTPREADSQALNELKNTAQQSRQIVSSLAGAARQIGDVGGKTGQMMAGQMAFGGQQGMGRGAGGTGLQAAGATWSTQGPGQAWRSPAQGMAVPGWQCSYSQPGQWTGTQWGEGGSGMGPSSLAQWSRWGGQPSWTGGAQSAVQSNISGMQPNRGQNWRAAAQNWRTGQPWQSPTQGVGPSGWQSSYSQPGQWTGTQWGEGRSGMGPSSLAQWSRWGGQPSWTRGYAGAGFGSAGQFNVGETQGVSPYAYSDPRNREFS